MYCAISGMYVCVGIYSLYHYFYLIPSLLYLHSYTPTHTHTHISKHSHSAKDSHFEAQPPLWQAEGLTFGWADTSIPTNIHIHTQDDKEKRKEDKEIKLLLTSQEKQETCENNITNTNTQTPTHTKEILLPASFWSLVRTGQDVYLHVFITESPGLQRHTHAHTEGEEEAEEVEMKGHDGYMPLHGVVDLVKRQVCVYICMCVCIVERRWE